MKKSNANVVRISGYVTLEDKDHWLKIIKRAAQIERFRVPPDNGFFFRRIILHDLRLDEASLSAYVKTHDRETIEPPKTRPISGRENWTRLHQQCQDLQERLEHISGADSNVEHYARMRLTNALAEVNEILEAFAKDEENP